MVACNQHLAGLLGGRVGGVSLSPGILGSMTPLMFEMVELIGYSRVVSYSKLILRLLDH